MDLEFNFYVRDRLKEYFLVEDLAKLQIKDYPLNESKEVLIDIITYCSLGKHAKNKLHILGHYFSYRGGSKLRHKIKVS